MGILVHHIEEIIKVNKYKNQYGADIVEVEMITDCNGSKEKTTRNFFPCDWKKVKKNGYYMTMEMEGRNNNG